MYVSNNPIRYNDPSGHRPSYCDQDPGDAACDEQFSGGTGEGDPPSTIEEELAQYGVTLKGGEWAAKDKKRKEAALAAVQLVAAAFAEAYNANLMLLGTNQEPLTAAEAFRLVYRGGLTMTWGNGPGCGHITGGGCTGGANHISFRGLSGGSVANVDLMTKNIVHELGHAYEWQAGHRSPVKDAAGNYPFIRPSGSMSSTMINGRDLFLRANPENTYDWQQHPLDMSADGPTGSEAFGDMFIAWTYNAWNTDTENADEVAEARAWMYQAMPLSP